MARTLLHIELGPVQIDVPQAVGYYGGIGAGLALGILEPPLAAFIAAVPLIKILAERSSSPVRFVGELLEGAAKPIGGDAEGTVRLADRDPAGRDTEALESVAEPVAAKTPRPRSNRRSQASGAANAER
jgi:hypothetical protein